MKRCQKCGRTYQDDNQKFCTVDGGRLDLADSAAAPPELGATLLTNQGDANPPTPLSDLNRTVASLPPPPTGEIRQSDTGPTSNRTIAASFQPAELPPPPAPPTYQAPPQPPQYQPQPPYQQPPPAYQQQPPQQQYQQPQYQQQPPPPQQQQYQQAQASAPPSAPPQHMAGQSQPPAAPRPMPAVREKGSRLPLIIGAVVLVLLLGGGAAYYFLVLSKKESSTANVNSNANVTNANVTANTNASTNVAANTNTSSSFTPPPDATQFINTSANLTGKLAENFVPFSFYYPNSWELNTSIASEGTYFVRAERKLPPNFVQERFAVERYASNGTYAADEDLFAREVAIAESNLAKLPGYEKLSEGATKVNSMAAYEIKFQALTENTAKGDITYWGRVIFLPPGAAGQKNGLKLTLLTSSLAPELEGIDDVGVKGGLPVILDSLRLK